MHECIHKDWVVTGASGTGDDDTGTHSLLADRAWITVFSEVVCWLGSLRTGLPILRNGAEVGLWEVSTSQSACL